MTLPYPVIIPLFLSPEAQFGFLHPYFAQTQIGLVLSAYPLGLFIGAFLLGKLADRYDKKSCLLFTLFLSIGIQLFSGYCVAEKYYLGLLISRFFLGLAEGNVTIAQAALAIVCKTETSKRIQFARTNAAITLGWTIGPLLGALLSGYAFSYFGNYSALFYMSAGLTLIIFLLVCVYFKTPVTLISPEFVSTEPAVFGRKILFFCSLLLTLGVDTFYQFFPVYLSVVFKCSPLLLGLAVSIVALANTLTHIFVTPMVEKIISSIHALIFFPALLSASLFLIAHSTYLGQVFTILPLIGVLIALSMTHMIVLISVHYSESKQGSIMGWLLSQRTLGTVFLSLSMSFLLLPYREVFNVGGLFVLLAVSFIIFHGYVVRPIRVKSTVKEL